MGRGAGPRAPAARPNLLVYGSQAQGYRFLYSACYPGATIYQGQAKVQYHTSGS